MYINDSGMKKCGFCREDIPARVRRCPYCGSLLNSEEVKNDDTEIWENKDTNSDTADDTVILLGAGDINENTAYSQDNASKNTYEYNIQTPKGNISNGLKVFLTVICTIIPGFGQLAGIIIGIVFMNMEDDPDRKSFGVALLVAFLILFVLYCLSCFFIMIVISSVRA